MKKRLGAGWRCCAQVHLEVAPDVGKLVPEVTWVSQLPCFPVQTFSGDVNIRKTSRPPSTQLPLKQCFSTFFVTCSPFLRTTFSNYSDKSHNATKTLASSEGTLARCGSDFSIVTDHLKLAIVIRHFLEFFSTFRLSSFDCKKWNSDSTVFGRTTTSEAHQWTGWESLFTGASIPCLAAEQHF